MINHSACLNGTIKSRSPCQIVTGILIFSVLNPQSLQNNKLSSIYPSIPLFSALLILLAQIFACPCSFNAFTSISGTNPPKAPANSSSVIVIQGVALTSAHFLRAVSPCKVTFLCSIFSGPISEIESRSGSP